jgi:glucosamine--fructose-6-phosphate aminotransferase (isomerizing)
MGLLEAATKTMNENLRGTWGLVAIDKEKPEQMLVARHGSPLLIGFDEHSLYVASERIAFEKYTQNYIVLEDGEALLLDLTKRSSFLAMFRERLNIIQEKVHVQLTPSSPYSSFYEQEINEQP